MAIILSTDYPCFLMVAMPRTTSCNLSFRVFCRDSSLDLADSWKRNHFEEKDENTKNAIREKVCSTDKNLGNANQHFGFLLSVTKADARPVQHDQVQEHIENSFAKLQI